MLLSEMNYQLRKAAAGDSQTFETALAAIGRAAISSRCPAVTKNEIGFQLLDSDEDNTRAVGVFGFKIGGRLLYVPMFYRDGVTKGVEQLRDPKRKRTVPLTDNWVNKLTVESGDDPPRRVPRSSLRDAAQPSLWQLKYPPTKWASAPADWTDEVRRDLARALTYGGAMTDPPADVDLIKLAGEHPVLLDGVQELTRLYPWFGDALVRYHGAEKVAAAIDRAERPAPQKKRAVKLAAHDRPKLLMIRVRQVSLSAVPSSQVSDYDPADLGELRAGRNAYKDSRDANEVSVLEAKWDGHKGGGNSLCNPDQSGVQQVLGLDGELHECAVLFPLTAWEATPNDCLVIRTSDGAWARADRNSVWVMPQTGNDLDAAVAWHEKLEPVDSAPTGDDVTAVFLAPGKHLHASVPFRFNGDGSVSECYYYGNASYWAQAGRNRDYVEDPGRERQDCPKRVRVSDSAGRMVVASNCLYLPGKDRVRLATLPYDKKLKLACGDDPDVFLFPNFKAASVGADVLHVNHEKYGGTFRVEGRFGVETLPCDSECEAHLVERHHMRVADARSLVEGARAFKESHAVVRYPEVKSAAPLDKYRLPTDWPNAPNVEDPIDRTPASFAEDVVPTETATDLEVAVPDMAEQPGTTEAYRPYPIDAGTNIPMPGIGLSGDLSDRKGIGPDDVETVAAAARSGSKELFDTAALASLVKRTGLDAVINKVIKASTSWMNASADALVHLAWNTDEWAERFGQTEIGAMEDQLRDHFEGLGDIALSLQEKSVNGGRDFGLLPQIDTVDSTDAAGG